MKKIISLTILGIVALLLPAINTIWVSIGNALIEAFGITDATAMGRFLIVAIRAGPYLIPVLLVIIAILIIRGGRETKETIE